MMTEQVSLHAGNPDRSCASSIHAPGNQMDCNVIALVEEVATVRTSTPIILPSMMSYPTSSTSCNARLGRNSRLFGNTLRSCWIRSTASVPRCSLALSLNPLRLMWQRPGFLVLSVRSHLQLLRCLQRRHEAHPVVMWMWHPRHLTVLLALGRGSGLRPRWMRVGLWPH